MRTRIVKVPKELRFELLRCAPELGNMKHVEVGNNLLSKFIVGSEANVRAIESPAPERC